MEKKLKFRAWNGEQMISPDYVDRNGVAHWKENSIPTTSSLVMISTGGQDKEGNLMYEGDVLWDELLGGHIKIVYDTSTCAFLGVGIKDEWDQFLYEFPFNKLTVVGNIYQDNKQWNQKFTKQPNRPLKS